MTRSEQPWYRDGLRFSCTRCGSCCRGAGNVWVSDEEIASLASVRDMTEPEFRSAYTKRSGRSGVILGAKRNQDCVFWDDETGCEVYQHRPRQCRTYPFWQGIVDSPENWREEARACPGVGEGELHPASEIATKAADDGIPAIRTRKRSKGS